MFNTLGKPVNELQEGVWVAWSFLARGELRNLKPSLVVLTAGGALGNGIRR